MIYVASYETESGDKGVAGYWEGEPTEDALDAYFRERHPDEYDEGVCCISWEVLELGAVV